MCWDRRQQEHLRSGLVIGAVLLLIGLVVALFSEFGEATQLARLGLLLLTLEVGSVVLHELGHMLAGLLMGFRIHRLSLGYGPTLGAFRIGDLLVDVHSYPVCGFVQGGSQSGAFARLRHAVFALGGPAVNAGLALVAWERLPAEWPDELAMQDVTVWHLLLVVNGLILAFNLFPYAFPASGDPADKATAWQPNDGLLTLSSLFAAPARVLGWQHAALVADAERHLSAGREEEAERLLEAGLAQFPNAVTLRLLQAKLATRRKAWGQAEEIQRAVLANEELGGRAKLVALSGLGRTLLERGDLDDAERVSKRALALAPGDPSIRKTRGEVLLGRGYVAQSEVLFRGLLAGADDPEERAEYSCLLALARLEAGDREEAARLLASALKLDPGNPRLEALERRL